jgi:hypothetical protein
LRLANIGISSVGAQAPRRCEIALSARLKKTAVLVLFSYFMYIHKGYFIEQANLLPSYKIQLDRKTQIGNYELSENKILIGSQELVRRLPYFLAHLKLFNIKSRDSLKDFAKAL